MIFVVHPTSGLFSGGHKTRPYDFGGYAHRHICRF